MKKHQAFIAVFASLMMWTCSASAQQYLRHQVEYGETVYSIPVHYGITTKEFLAINEMDYNNIQLKVGQSVRIRELTAAEMASNKPEPAVKTEPEERAQSSKEEIMRKIKEDVEAANAVAMEKARIEQERYLKERAELEKLEAEAEANLAKAQAEAARLKAEQAEKEKPAPVAVVKEEKVVVPTVKAAPAPTTNAPSFAMSDEDLTIGPNGIKYQISTNGYHVVEKKQTMFHLAKIYKLTVDELKSLNNLTTTDINIGQKLKVRN